MRLLGVLGGMSWTSTATYDRLLHEGVAARLGGLHSARLLVHSVDFAPIAQAQHDGDWDATAALLGEAAAGLAAGGAEALLLATSTMHKVSGAIEAASGIPLIHIADATAAALVADGRHRVGLLATAFTMEERFSTERREAAGLEVAIPTPDDRADVHRIIYDELCHDRVLRESRATYQRVVQSLAEVGADSVILGCTEIGLLVGPQDLALPAYDTTAIHAAAGVDFLLDDY